MILKIAAAFLIFIAASFLLTPRSEKGWGWTEVGDPRDERRSFRDPGHSWHHERGGQVVRKTAGTEEIVGRFASTTRQEAELVVRWKSMSRKGLLLAPHLFGKRLFFIHHGSTQGVTLDAFLKRIEGASPAL